MKINPYHQQILVVIRIIYSKILMQISVLYSNNFWREICEQLQVLNVVLVFGGSLGLIENYLDFLFKVTKAGIGTRANIWGMTIAIANVAFCWEMGLRYPSMNFLSFLWVCCWFHLLPCGFSLIQLSFSLFLVLLCTYNSMLLLSQLTVQEIYSEKTYFFYWQGLSRLFLPNSWLKSIWMVLTYFILYP